MACRLSSKKIGMAKKNRRSWPRPGWVMGLRALGMAFWPCLEDACLKGVFLVWGNLGRAYG